MNIMSKMKTRILYGDCVAVDYYELDDKGNMVTPDEPTYGSDGDGFYLVEVWSDDTHHYADKQFETFNEAKEYADNIKGENDG